MNYKKNMKNLTSHLEAFQKVIWHLLVSHPDIKKYAELNNSYFYKS